MKTKKQIIAETKKLLEVANADKTHIGQTARCQADSLRWVTGDMNLEPHHYTDAHAHYIKNKIVGPTRP